MEVNHRDFHVLKQLGKGKGGYSYLITDGDNRYVLKQIHHEPCDYYQFGNKMEAELRDYRRLQAVGIPMPRLLDADMENERILKEYVEGETVYTLICRNEMNPDFEAQVRKMCDALYPAGLNIDYFPPILWRGTESCFTSTTSAMTTWSSGILTTGASGTGLSRRSFFSMPGKRAIYKEKAPLWSVWLHGGAYLFLIGLPVRPRR